MNKEISAQIESKLTELGFQSNSTLKSFYCEVEAKLVAFVTIADNNVTGYIVDTVESTQEGWEGWIKVESEKWIVEYKEDLESALTACVQYTMTKAKHYLFNNKQVHLMSPNHAIKSVVVAKVD